MRRLRILAAAASIAVIAACGSNDNGDDTTAVPEGDPGSSESDAAGQAAPIVSTRWVLDEADTADASVQAGQDIDAWLQIDDAGEASGSTGCNGFSGSAEVGEDVITFQPLIATKKGCSGELGDLDSAMLGVLRGEVTAEVEGDALTLTNADDETLTLTVGDAPASES